MLRPLLIVAALICLAAVGCDSRPAGTKGTAGKKSSFQIAVIPKATTYDFWKSVHAGANQAGEKLNVEILWKGPVREGDVEGQINVVQDFISKRVDGICLAPTDSQALMSVVQQARDEGIPVVIYDSGLADDSNAVATVATNNYKAGAIAAQHMGKILDGKGNVIVLRYTPGSQSTEMREQGFLETLTKKFPGIQVISANEYAGDTAETALDKGQKLLEQFDDVQGVFTPCEHVTSGMLQALVDAELAGKIKFVGFDASPRLVQALKDGTIDGLVLQDPVKMASLAVEKLVDHLSNKKVDKQISSGEWIATPENLNEPEIQQLLEPARVE